MKKRDVIIACDFPSAQATLDFLKRFEEQKPFVKIGMEPNIFHFGKSCLDIWF